MFMALFGLPNGLMSCTEPLGFSDGFVSSRVSGLQLASKASTFGSRRKDLG